MKTVYMTAEEISLKLSELKSLLTLLQCGYWSGGNFGNCFEFGTGVHTLISVRNIDESKYKVELYY